MNVDGLMIDPLINNLILSGAALTLTRTELELLYFIGAKARARCSLEIRLNEL